MRPSARLYEGYTYAMNCTYNVYLCTVLALRVSYIFLILHMRAIFSVGRTNIGTHCLTSVAEKLRKLRKVSILSLLFLFYIIMNTISGIC
jgi:hypothetical protein